jgi:hypothetical protein
MTFMYVGRSLQAGNGSGSAVFTCVVLLAIPVVALIAFYLKQTPEQKGLVGRVDLYCKACGTVGRPVRSQKGFIGAAGSDLVAVAQAPRWACPKCSSVELIPTDSPIAKAAIAQLHGAATTTKPEEPPR